jgi:acyl CoA:acetate/3-ketoacid CoA transferase alpha subunit
MEEKIKNALKLAGLDVGLCDKIVPKVTTEEQILPAIIEYVKQSEGDRRVTQATQTQTEKIRTLEQEKAALEAKITAAGSQNAAGTNTGGSGTGAGSGTPDITKTLQEVLASNAALKAEVDALKGKDSEKDRSVIVAAQLKAAGLKETLAPFIAGKTEDEIKQQVETLKAETIAVKQAELDAALAAGGGAPNRGTVGDKANTETVNSIVSKHPFKKEAQKE